MSFLELFLLALALAMDAFAVAICVGCSLRKVSRAQYLRLPLAFGFFQFLMPVLGWLLGLTVRDFIESWDHWIAFILLAWIGGNMIRNSLSSEQACADGDPTLGRNLILLAIATSIDALAVGLSFSLLQLNVLNAALLIGVVCAIITLLGLIAGSMLAHATVLSKRAELFGGTVLLLIGCKILYEHGVFDAVMTTPLP